MSNSEHKDYELHVCSDTGDQWRSGQSFDAGMRTMDRCVEEYIKLCKESKCSRMLRLFGPHGDKKWGFIVAYIIDAQGNVTERTDVTVPEPFFSGKQPGSTPGYSVRTDRTDYSMLDADKVRADIETALKKEA